MFSVTRTIMRGKAAPAEVLPDFYAAYDNAAGSAQGHGVSYFQGTYSTNRRVGATSLSLVATNSASTTGGVRYGTRPEFAFGTGDFSISCWAYCTSYSGGQGYGRTLVDMRPLNANGAYLAFGLNADGTANFFRSNVTVSSTKVVPLNTWCFYLIVRSAGVTTLYVNGESFVSAPDPVNYLLGDFKVGLGAFYQAAPTTGWQGLIDDVKLYKGKVIAPSVPAAPDPKFRVTFEDGVNTLQNHTVSLNQNVQISDQMTPYGVSKVAKFAPSSSASTTSALRYTPQAAEATLSNGDFTISFWVNPTTYPTNGQSATFLEMRPGVNGAYLWCGLNPSGSIYLYRNSTAFTSNTTLPLNKWTQVVITRRTNVTTVYQDGVSVYAGGDTTNYLAGDLRIGHPAFYTSEPYNSLNGYIDDVRIYTEVGLLPSQIN